MRLTREEKQIVQRLVKHGLDLVAQDMVQYKKGQKKEQRKKLIKLLESIQNKIQKDLEEEK